MQTRLQNFGKANAVENDKSRLDARVMADNVHKFFKFIGKIKPCHRLSVAL